MVAVGQPSRVAEVEGVLDGAVFHVVVGGVVIDIFRPGIASEHAEPAAESLVDGSKQPIVKLAERVTHQENIPVIGA